MKNEQNQPVKTIGILGMFALLSACFLVSAPIWNRPFAEETEKTMHRAESLGYQILTAKKNQMTNTRMPASEAPLSHLEADQGKIGLDSWGRPFQFKWLSTAKSQSRLLVWSLGPNGVADTDAPGLDSNREKSDATFSGDDVGVMLTIK